MSVGRAIIEALPKLFSKNQTIPARVVDILALPRLVSLDLYLEGQQVSVRSPSFYVSGAQC